MKSILIIVLSGLTFFSLNIDSKNDTKKFIIETIKANPPISECENSVTFQNIEKLDIVKSQLEKLSIDELDYLFYYSRDCFRKPYNNNETYMVVGDLIDIRGVANISTTRMGSENGFYFRISLELSGNYRSQRYFDVYGEKKHEEITEMEILIKDDAIVAEKIKKAIIHLSKLSGVEITDKNKN